MKSIFNLIITAVICLTLSSAAMNPSDLSRTYTLQSTGKNVTLPLLTKSADIISARLKIYGLQSYSVKANADKGQIVVELADNIEISELEGLLTSSGELAFYETSDINNLPSLLKAGKAGKPIPHLAPHTPHPTLCTPHPAP